MHDAPRSSSTPRIRVLQLDDGDAGPGSAADIDPGDVMLTCANCGARMDERRCKLICACGYFLSCSDYC
jgi:hypothetical protein